MPQARDNPLTPQDAPALAPLVNSYEANQTEAELKAIFIDLFNSMIRPQERVVNTAGSPHLGPMSQVESATKQEGLALLRRAATDDDAMLYIFKSWRARNPKRGLHMLRIYLQMLWPNSWTLFQLWHEKGQPYPTALATADGGNHYLTSRVRVTVTSGYADGSDVAKVAQALRSVLPARMMLELRTSESLTAGQAMACAATALSYAEFTGTMS